MANQYLDQLSEETSPATSDLMLLEQSDTSTENKITILNLLSIIDALTAIDAVAAADELPLYDATASSVKKATITQLGVGLGHVVELPVIEWATACSTGDGKYYFVVPPKYNGLNLTGVHGQVVTPGTTGTMDIQVYNVTQDADMLSTVLTIDSEEDGSDTAATPAVIDEDNDDVASYDVLSIDIDAIHTTPAEGLVVTLTFG